MGREPGTPQWSPVTGLEATGTNKTMMFPLNISNIISTLRVTKHCHRLARGIVRFLSVEIFKSHLDTIPALGRGFGSDWLQRSLPDPSFCGNTGIKRTDNVNVY